MNKKTEFRICPYCQKEFEVKTTSRQVYCKRTCSTYMTEVRKGKRELPHREPTEQSTFQEVFEANQEALTAAMVKLEQLINEIPILKQEYLKVKLEKSNISMNYEVETSNEAIEYLEERIERTKNDITPEELAELESRKQILINRIEEYKVNAEAVKKRYKELKVLIPAKIVARFRLAEFCSITVKQAFKNKKVLSGKETLDLKKFTANYPFKELSFNHSFVNFIALDAPSQPFICNVFGNKKSGKTSLLLNLCLDFIKYFDSKIFYAIDPDNIAFEDAMLKKNINASNISILRLEGQKDLTQSLDDTYEFLILDISKSYLFNYQFLSKLQKQYPKLSVFIVSENQLKGLEKGANMVIEVRNGVGQMMKGGTDENCIFGWDDADCDHFYSDDEPEASPDQDYIDYEEMEAYEQPFQQQLPPQRNFMDDFLMFAEMMNQIQGNQGSQQNTVTQEESLKKSIAQDLEIKLLEEQIAKKKGH